MTAPPPAPTTLSAVPNASRDYPPSRFTPSVYGVRLDNLPPSAQAAYFPRANGGLMIVITGMPLGGTAGRTGTVVYFPGLSAQAGTPALAAQQERMYAVNDPHGEGGPLIPGRNLPEGLIPLKPMSAAAASSNNPTLMVGTMMMEVFTRGLPANFQQQVLGTLPVQQLMQWGHMLNHDLLAHADYNALFQPHTLPHEGGQVHPSLRITTEGGTEPGYYRSGGQVYFRPPPGGGSPTQVTGGDTPRVLLLPGAGTQFFAFRQGNGWALYNANNGNYVATFTGQDPQVVRTALARAQVTPVFGNPNGIMLIPTRSTNGRTDRWSTPEGDRYGIPPPNLPTLNADTSLQFRRNHQGVGYDIDAHGNLVFHDFDDQGRPRERIRGRDYGDHIYYWGDVQGEARSFVGHMYGPRVDGPDGTPISVWMGTFSGLSAQPPVTIGTNGQPTTGAGTRLYLRTNAQGQPTGLAVDARGHEYVLQGGAYVQAANVYLTTLQRNPPASLEQRMAAARALSTLNPAGLTVQQRNDTIAALMTLMRSLPSSINGNPQSDSNFQTVAMALARLGPAAVPTLREMVQEMAGMRWPAPRPEGENFNSYDVQYWTSVALARAVAVPGPSVSDADRLFAAQNLMSYLGPLQSMDVSAVHNQQDKWLTVMHALAAMGPSLSAEQRQALLNVRHGDATTGVTLRSELERYLGPTTPSGGLTLTPVLAAQRRDAAFSAVLALGGPAAIQPLASGLLDPLRRSLETGNPDTLPLDQRLAAVRMLRQITPYLTGASRDQAVIALNALVRGPSSIPPELRLAAASAVHDVSFRSSSAPPPPPTVALATLISQLRSDQAPVRQNAYTQLQARGAEAAPALIALLGSGDAPAGARLSAAELLSRLPAATPGVVAALTTALGSSDTAVVMQAATALGNFHAAGAVPALTGLLTHANSNVRGTAILALASIGAPARMALPQMQTILADTGQDNAVRVAAASAILRLSPDAAVRAQTLTALGGLGALTPAGAAAVHGALGDTSPAVRIAAAQVLAQRGGRLDVGPLLALLNDSDNTVKTAAIRALGAMLERRSSLGPAAAQIDTSLLAVLRNRPPGVPLAAFANVQVAGANDLVAPLAAALRGFRTGGPEATAAASLLVRIGPQGQAALRTLIAEPVNETNTQPRVYAVRALATAPLTGNPAAADNLAALIAAGNRNDASEVRLAAWRAMLTPSMVQATGTLLPGNAVAISFLSDVLNGREAWSGGGPAPVRLAAASALGGMPRSAAVVTALTQASNGTGPRFPDNIRTAASTALAGLPP